MNYFEPCLSWQQPAWQRLTTSFPDVAHALLIAGPRGTGKLHFAQRLIAWVLCQQAGGVKSAVSAQQEDDGLFGASGGGLFGDDELPMPQAADTACGACDSCNWLKANTHPQFLHVTADPEGKSDIIKVDTIRKILPFTQQSSQGFRVVLIEQAHNMNMSAANALLKTLEEPAKNVLIVLTSDQPQRLLPTIRSRVQSVLVSSVTDAQAYDYVNAQTEIDIANSSELSQLLTLAGGAPLLVDEIAHASWYAARHNWLKVWQALRAGQRNSVAASQFWQKQLSFSDALQLQQIVCRDLLAKHSEQAVLLQDVNYEVLLPLPEVHHIEQIGQFVSQCHVDMRQNVQPALLFDMLMKQLAAT